MRLWKPVDLYRKRKMTFETGNESPVGFTFLLRPSGLLCHLRSKISLSRLLASNAHFSGSAAAVRSGLVVGTQVRHLFLRRRAVGAENEATCFPPPGARQTMRPRPGRGEGFSQWRTAEWERTDRWRWWTNRAATSKGKGREPMGGSGGRDWSHRGKRAGMQRNANNVHEQEKTCPDASASYSIFTRQHSRRR